ncbi:MAG: ferredoxin [Chloroflexi bacterium]|nr:ferredoxin [Chloroflexota bacterium]MBU1746600.1 ferredoxin [Chloroflexota bacterium]
MKITIDLELCTGCGTCEAVCPEVFELDDEGFARVIAEADCAEAGCCEEAADSCPEEAITIG